MRLGTIAIPFAALFCFIPVATLHAVDKNFHDAPDSAKAMTNPYQGKQDAADAGKPLYARNCLACHGKARATCLR
jgi:mono/diheme cytochrome c family protein